MARHSRHTPFWQSAHIPTAGFPPCVKQFIWHPG
jgi:hypothetical protein